MFSMPVCCSECIWHHPNRVFFFTCCTGSISRCLCRLFRGVSPFFLFLTRQVLCNLFCFVLCRVEQALSHLTKAAGKAAGDHFEGVKVICYDSAGWVRENFQAKALKYNEVLLLYIFISNIAPCVVGLFFSQALVFRRWTSGSFYCAIRRF